MKSKRSSATDISLSVKKKVWCRDGGRCVFCGNTNASPNAHVISRAKGGLGIEQNIITLCWECHEKMDHTTDRQKLLGWARNYLQSIYGEIEEREVTYKK